MIPVPSQVLEQLAAFYGVQADQLRRFGGGREDSDGIVYSYPSGTGRQLLKILAIPEKDQHRGLFCLDERLRFVRFLGEHQAPIVYPLLSPQGNLYESTFMDGHLWVGYSMDIAPGELMDGKTWQPDFYRNWGKTIGMLHRLAKEYPAWENSIDPETGAAYLTWREEWQSFVDWCQDEDVKRKWGEIGARLAALPVTQEVYGFIHNDPHIMNLLFDGQKITVLDFDVANHHWFINDIAIACQGLLFSLAGGMERPVHHPQKVRDFLRLFMEGYETENHLPEGWLDQIDLFIAYRRLLLFTVMQGWINSKPDLLKSWKQMILEEPEVVGKISS